MAVLLSAVVAFTFLAHFAHVRGLQWFATGAILLSVLYNATHFCETLKSLPRACGLALTFWTVYASLTTLWSPVPLATLEALLFSVWLPGVLFVAGWLVGDEPRKARRVLQTFLLASFIAAAVSIGSYLFGFREFLLGGDGGVRHTHWLVRWYAGPGLLTTFLLLGTPLIWWGLRAELISRRTAFLALIWMALSAVLAENRMFFLAAGVMIVLALLLSYGRRERGLGKYVLILTVVGATVATVIVFSNIRTSQKIDAEAGAKVVASDIRLTWWRYWGDLAARAPLLGHGYGKKAADASHDRDHPLFRTIDQPEKAHPHNLLVSLAVQTGMVGVMAFLVALATLALRGADRSISDSSRKGAAEALLMLVTALLLKNLTDDFYDWLIPCLFWLYAGVLLRQTVVPIEVVQSASKSSLPAHV